MIKPKTGLFAALILCWMGTHSPSLLAEEELIYEGPAHTAPPAKNYTQEWQVLPGESLQSLATLFYPRSPRMQQRFVSSTIALNREKLANMSPRQPFEQGTTLRIPDLRALSFQAGGHTAESISSTPASGTPHKAAAPDSTGKTEYSAITKRHQSRKQELEALNKRLQSLEDSSKAMKQQLVPSALPSADEPVPKALKRVQAPEMPVPDSESPLQVALYLLAAVLMLGGVLAYRWHKTRVRKPVRTAAPAAPSPLETAVPAAFRSQPAKPAAAQFKPAPPAPVTREEATQTDSMSVDEIESVVEEAHVIVALGRTSNAIKLLSDYIERHPRTSVSPWLYLLDLYRATSNRAEFEATGKRMHATFNVMVPAWDNGNTPLSVPTSLEEFPHLMQKVTSIWGTKECRDFLNHLVEDNRGGERIGFSVSVMQEIVALISVLDTLIQK
jgi:hypothetical protein